MKKKHLVVFLVTFFLAVQNLSAQCVMCTATVESNNQMGGSVGSGLNAGIGYLMIFPYLLLSLLGFIWYRNNKKRKQQESK